MAGSEWAPRIPEGAGTLHDRLVKALCREIGCGALAPGDKLPTHRELAHRLGIGVGTVTKAYAEVKRLGFLSGDVGRGTFVSDRGAAPSGKGGSGAIDLSLNLPPIGPSATQLPKALASLAKRGDVRDYASFAPHAGFDAHRKAGAAWLARAGGYPADWQRLLVCSGAQHAMWLALDVLRTVGAGSIVLTDAATFHGMRVLADARGLRCVGLPMDREGMLPEALDRAAEELGPGCVAYLQPTLQNPTARTMSRGRREDVSRIARRRNAWLLEGDVYAPLAWSGTAASVRLPALASLIPERTIHVSSVSKALAPGLRTGFLTLPDATLYAAAEKAMRANCYSADAFGPLVATQWIEDGTADQILREVAEESAKRTRLALNTLGDAVEAPAHISSLHVWVPLEPLAAEQVAGRAMREGVALTPPTALRVAGDLASGLRLCLGAACDIATLERALAVIVAALSDTSSTVRIV